MTGFVYSMAGLVIGAIAADGRDGRAGPLAAASVTVTWSCKCGKRTFLHHDWCGSCGDPRPRPPKPEPSKLPSVLDDLKKD